MKKLLPSIAFLSLFLAGNMATAQVADTIPEPIDLLLEQLDKHQRLQPQEKLYVHLEKEMHRKGEHLWFKLYLVAGAKHRPSPISTGAFVELINPKGETVNKLYVKINRGQGYGDIAIPNDWPKGNYRLKAYTEWMKNFDWDYQPVYPVTIGKDATTKAEASGCEVAFFPEGGQWVAGLSQNLAFRSEGNQAIKGHIENKAGEAVVQLESNALGLGRISFTADSSETYFARIEGCNNPIPMPYLRKTGTVMTATKMGNRFLRLDILTNQEPDGSLLHAVIQARGVVVNQLKVQVAGDRARALIPLNDLPVGISQISLFDENLAQLAERLVFKDESSELNIKASQSSGKDKWQKVNLNLTDEQGEAMAGHFSVGVFTEAAPPAFANIDQYFNLSAELVGIEQPKAYFDPETGKANENMELLMMTQKWSWITWKNLKMNRMVRTNKSLNDYMNEAYYERQQFEEDEDAIASLDANARRLDDVVVVAKREPVVQETVVQKIYGKGDGGSIEFDDYIFNNSETFIDVIRGRIAGVRVSGSPLDPKINIRGTVTGQSTDFAELEPLILLNNIPTTVSIVLDIPANMIQSIEVFKGASTSLFGLRGAGGAIAIYTSSMPPERKKQQEVQEDAEEEKPEYSVPARFEGRPSTNDIKLLHWSPLLTTDEEGELKFEYKKPNDYEGPVYLRLQGISRSGVAYSNVIKLD